MANRSQNTLFIPRGPLTFDEKVECRRLPFGYVYVRACELGQGEHFPTQKTLLHIFRLRHDSNMTDITLVARNVSRMTPFLPGLFVTRYGEDNLREAIHMHVAAIEDFDPAGFQVQPNQVISGDVLDRFLNEFGAVMRTRVQLDFQHGGRERGLGKKILQLAGGYDAAIGLMKSYFRMPPEWRGDDFSFLAFWQNIPRILHQRDAAAVEEYEMAAKERRFAQRGRMPTQEENEDFLRRGRAQIEENKQRRHGGGRPRLLSDEDDD